MSVEAQTEISPVGQRSRWSLFGPSRRVVVAIAIALLAAISLTGHLLSLSFHQPEADDGQYLAFAYNTLRHGVYSDSRALKPPPGYRREPGYPALLMLGMLLHPAIDVDEAPVGCITKGEGEFRGWRCSELVAYLKLPNLLLLLLTAIAAAWFVWRHTTSGPLTIACFSLIAFSAAGADAADRFRSETLSGFLILAFSMALATLPKTRLAFFALGMLAGALALTKAIYLYFTVPLVAAWLVYWFVERVPVQRMLQLASCHGAGLLLVVGPWMARNWAQCSTTSIAGRAGLAMTMRANLNELPWEQYPYAFLYSSRFLPTSKALFDQGPEEVRTFFDDPEQGFYGRAYAHERTLKDELQLSASASDAYMTREAERRILDNFAGNLRMIPPLLLLGLTSEGGVGFKAHPDSLGTLGEKYFGLNLSGVHWSSGYTKLLIGPLLFAVMLGLAVYLLRTRQKALLLFTLPAVYLVAMYALFTFFVRRYSVPILPVAYVCLCIALAKVAAGRTQRLEPPA